jgi:Group II intron, maturase-specific domain
VSGNNDPWPEVRDALNRSLLGWSNYFCQGTRRSAFRGVDRYVYERVRDFLARRHNSPCQRPRSLCHRLRSSLRSHGCCRRRREGFEGEVFSLTLARESVRAAKFLIAGEPAEAAGKCRRVGCSRPARLQFWIAGAITPQSPGTRLAEPGEVVGTPGPSPPSWAL